LQGKKKSLAVDNVEAEIRMKGKEVYMKGYYSAMAEALFQ